MTSDQVDNLLDELNELVAHPKASTAETIEAVTVQQVPDGFGLDYLNVDDGEDDDKSPYLPKRYSVLESGAGGAFGGSSASPEENNNFKNTSPFHMQYQQHRQAEDEELYEDEEGDRGYTTGVIKLEEDSSSIQLRQYGGRNGQRQRDEDEEGGTNV